MQNEILIDSIFNNNKRAVSRAISYIETESSYSTEILKSIHKKIGNAYRIGITGPPGAGKSTLTNQITKYYRSLNKTVGIIAVDPTSPFTGGALLGDRVRMSEIGVDPGVFIRSMATRGSLGGLSKRAIDAADVIDAAGYNYVLIETVGVGQSELDIAKVADTTIVVLVPESGDAIQAMKAGLMEIADFFVLNKSDRPGADGAMMALKTILMLRPFTGTSWFPEILKSIASENNGIKEIVDEISRHRNFLETSGLLIQKRQENYKRRIKGIVELMMKEELWKEQRDEQLESSLSQVVNGKASPYSVAENLFASFKCEINHKG